MVLFLMTDDNNTSKEQLQNDPYMQWERAAIQWNEQDINHHGNLKPLVYEHIIKNSLQSEM